MAPQKICVLGLGYIGLPTASMFATHGFEVHGVDINRSIIDTLNSGRMHIKEPGLSTVVKAAFGSGNLKIGDKPVPSDVFIIAVPTPYHHASGIPTADLSFVKAATESILPLLKKGNAVILESTSPPGTTRDLITPLLNSTKLKVGTDIGLAYCPERVIPGQALKELIGNDRVIGAVTAEWAEHIKNLYKAFVGGEIFLTDPTTAEMVKIAENTFRDVNIALANEMAILCEKLKINVWDVIRIANRHPRVNVHRPGPGVGGHCISVDPWFLVEKFPQDAKVIHLARQINDSIPARVVNAIGNILKGKPKAKIAILGLAYKANVDDLRESPAVTVVNLLKERKEGYTLAIYEPYANSAEFPTQSIQDVFKEADLAVVLTAHDEIRFLDPAEVGPLMKNRVVLDTHGVLKPEKWTPAGFSLHTPGTASFSS